MEYAFGSLDHDETFVGRDERGRPVMLRMSHYRSPRGTGWDIFTGLPSRPADEEEYLCKKMDAADGVRRWSNYHVINYNSILHEVGPVAADCAIGCEWCHGPGVHHVAAVAAGFPDPAIVGLGASAPSTTNQVCADCPSLHRSDAIDTPRASVRWLRYASLTLTWSRC